VESVVITPKPSASTKSVNAASTFMFVRVQRSPIKILFWINDFQMAKIQTIDEFKRIKESDFGFIVIFDGASNTLHQSRCENLTEDIFSNQDGNSLHWFSTIALAEKSYIITPCESCRPE
jgi:hypothetical protein